ncbi:MAG TPA: bifunctional UDP-sugar hydrolase/5'-nucleotidase [Acetobacteraceae bacterium]|nr:bifunctional UDP-sugar hydrolase/5'-nucleotidase [Acetobacteraceae bacterium]
MTVSRRSLLGVLGTLPLTQLAWGQAAHRLTIIHLNDFHSRHDPVDPRSLSCGRDGSAPPGCFGGSPRLAAAIRAQRAAAEADGRVVVLLDGGDQFQGSLFFTKYQGMAELAVQRAVGTDAMAVGNHEFDSGPEVLGAYARQAPFPLVSSNVDVTSEQTLAGLIRPYAVLERAGLRLGLVGLTTLETLTGSSPGPRVRFLEPEPALARAVDSVRAEGVQLVVLLSHMGIGFDRVLKDAGPAVVIGGHSHTLLSNTEPGAFLPHPSPDAARGLVVQAGAYGRYLGRLDLDLAADGTILQAGGDCVHVGLDVAPDPEVAAIVAGFREPLAAFAREVIATLPEKLDLAGCRLGPCRIGQLVAEAMLRATPGAQVAIMNAGGIRTGLPQGEVTRGQVLDALPFGNTVATLGLTGADLEEALRHGLSQVGRGGFPQWAGLRLEGAGFEVRKGDGWAPLDKAARYEVVTNNFLRGGGDGYVVFRDRAIDPYDSGPGLDEAFAEALGAGR